MFQGPQTVDDLMILLKDLKGYFAEDGYKFCFIGSGKGMEGKEKKNGIIRNLEETRKKWQ